MSEAVGAAPLDPGEAAARLRPYLHLKAQDSKPAPIVLAVSGGPDSVALMHLAAQIRDGNATVPIVVGTVDHGLRRLSADEAGQVAAWAEACGFRCHILRWIGQKPEAGLQEAARAARYDLLAGLAREIGASHLLTAHTLDDQAETILMRLARGSGLAGLVGMRSERPCGGTVLARPFLGLRKARLIATCQAENWPFLEDPSNADRRFARARLRRIMPILEDEGLSPERLAILAARLSRAEEALAIQAAKVFDAVSRRPETSHIELDGTLLLKEPAEIVLRVLTLAIAAVTETGTVPLRLQRLEALADGLVAIAGTRFRSGHFARNLAGALVRCHRNGCITVEPEPPRRGGSRPDPAHPAVPRPHSLGNRVLRA